MGDAIEFTIGAESSQVLHALDEVRMRADGVGDSLRRAGRHGKQAMDESFGDQVMGKVKGFALGIGTMTAAVGIYADAWRKAATERERAMGLGEAQGAAYQRLRQVATSEQDLGGLQHAVRRTEMDFKVSPDRAVGLQLALEARGWGRHREQFGQLFELGMDPTAAVGQVAGLSTLKRAGDPGQLLQMMAGGARLAGAPVGEFMGAVGGVTERARGYGASAAETIGAMSALTRRTGDTAESAEILNAILKAGGKAGSTGGILGAVKTLEGMSPEAVGKLFPKEGALRAKQARWLSSQELLTEEHWLGKAGDVIGGMAGMMTPEIQAAEDVALERKRLDLALTDARAGGAMERGRRQMRIERGSLEAGEGGLVRGLRTWQAGWLETLGLGAGGEYQLSRATAEEEDARKIQIEVTDDRVNARQLSAAERRDANPGE